MQPHWNPTAAGSTDASQDLDEDFLTAGTGTAAAAIALHAVSDGRIGAATVGDPPLLTAREGHEEVPHRSLRQPGFRREAQLPSWALITAALALKIIAPGCKQLACFSSSYATSLRPVAEGPHGGEGRSQHSLPLQAGSQRVSSGGRVWGLQMENKSPWRPPGATEELEPEWATAYSCGGHGPGLNSPSAAGFWGRSPVPTQPLFPTNPCLYYRDTISRPGPTSIAGITASPHFPPGP